MILLDQRSVAATLLSIHHRCNDVVLPLSSVTTHRMHGSLSTLEFAANKFGGKTVRGSDMYEKHLYPKELMVVSAFSLAFSSLAFVGPANAASTPKTITTCTNTKTNVMRLLVKGACNKKSEKAQIWIPKPATQPSPRPSPSDIPNTPKFNEYFSDFYLGKMDIGKVIGTDGFPTRTSTFTKGKDLFCSMMSIKKAIAAGRVANAIYDVTAKAYVQPRTYFPGEITAGGSGGCSSLDQPIGRYENRIYIDDVLVAVLAFEVK